MHGEAARPCPCGVTMDEAEPDGGARSIMKAYKDKAFATSLFVTRGVSMRAGSIGTNGGGGPSEKKAGLCETERGCGRVCSFPFLMKTRRRVALEASPQPTKRKMFLNETTHGGSRGFRSASLI